MYGFCGISFPVIHQLSIINRDAVERHYLFKEGRIMEGFNWDSVLQSAIIGGIIGGGIGALYMIAKLAIRWVRTGSLRDKE